MRMMRTRQEMTWRLLNVTFSLVRFISISSKIFLKIFLVWSFRFTLPLIFFQRLDDNRSGVQEKTIVDEIRGRFSQLHGILLQK